MTAPRRTLRRNLLLLGVVPTIVVGLILTIYWTNARLEGLRANLMAKGEAYARFIAPSLEYGIVTGSREQIRKSAKAIAADRDITSIRVTARNGLVLYAFEQEADTDTRDGWVAGLAAVLFPEERLRFLEAVHLTDSLPDIDGDDEVRRASSGEVGRVALYLTNRHLTVAQTEVILKGVAIILGILVLALLLAIHIGRTLSRPLEQLARTVDELRAGNLGIRCQEQTPGEIGILEQGVNEMASALQRSHEHMAEAVCDATARLQEQIERMDAKNRELEEARRMADEANHHKSRFVAWVSHEIRTPLNCIEGIIELMLPDAERHSELCRHRMHLMHQSAKDLQHLINDLLDISRIESGQIRLNPIRFDLHSLARRACGTLAHSNADRVRLEIDPDVPSHIHGDPLRYKQIFNNLVGNALKYAGTREVQVQLIMGPDRMLNLIVRDQGMGMDERTLSRIFDPYEQGPDEQRTVRGTGLGLTITKALAETMGGSIRVRSLPGHGSTFTVKLPITPVAATEAEAATPAKRDEGGDRILEGLRCLVADDDEANRMLSGWQIEKAGGIPVLVADGEEAVARCASERFDIVFLDIYMPRLDGLSALREIRALPTPPRRIVAITANCEQEVLDEYLHAGFDAALAKPLSTNALSRLMRETGNPRSPAPRQTELDADPPVIDRALAVERAGGSETLADKMLAILRRDARAILDELNTNSTDREALARISHKLRGGAGLCAAMRLEMACARMEKADPEHAVQWDRAKSELIEGIQAFLEHHRENCNPE